MSEPENKNPNDSPKNKENKILNVLASLSKKTQSLATPVWQQVHSGIELCGKHPFATGLFALISLAGLILSMVGFDLDREDAVVTSLQIEQLTTTLIKTHQLETQAKDEQIKALTQAITNLSKGQDVLGSKEQIKAAMTALTQGDTDKAKQLFSNAAQKGEQDALQTAKAYRNLGALAFLDNTQQALQAYRRATELDPNNILDWAMLGQLLQRVDELEEAKTIFNKVLSWGKRYPHKGYVAVAYNGLGSIYLKEKNWEKASEYFHKSLAIEKILDRKFGLATTYGNIGIVYERQGNLNQAYLFYKIALVINKKLDRKHGVADNYLGFGRILDISGEFNKAISMYQRALAIHFGT